MVPKVRFELTRPCGHYALNVARLPFRHFGSKDGLTLAYPKIFVNQPGLTGFFKIKLTRLRIPFRIYLG